MLSPGWSTVRCRVAIWLLAAAAALSFPAKAADSAAPDVARSILRGESFLTNLFEPRLNLLPEYRGSTTYWLFHDNYLAAHLLAGPRPDLSARIRAALAQFGVTNSGKIEIVFDEAPHPLPFRQYLLTNVALIDGKKIQTELVTTNLLQGWERYADLLLLASIAQAKSNPAEARRDFEKAAAMWDGAGLKDAATEHNGLHATYKLALYLLAADRSRIAPPHREAVIARLLSMQSPAGGWITDYKNEKPIGLANVETTCLTLLALKTIR